MIQGKPPIENVTELKKKKKTIKSAQEEIPKETLIKKLIESMPILTRRNQK